MQVANKKRDARGMALLALGCAFLQLALAPHIGLGNGRANFALVFTACAALSTGGKKSVIWSFVAGLFFDLCTTGPLGLMAFCMSFAAYFLGLEGRNRMAGDLGQTMVLFLISDVCVSFVYHLAMLLVGQADSIIDVLIFRTLPTALLTLIAFFPFAYYYARLRPAGNGLGVRGGHFSRRKV